LKRHKLLQNDERKHKNRIRLSYYLPNRDVAAVLVLLVVLTVEHFEDDSKNRIHVSVADRFRRLQEAHNCANAVARDVIGVDETETY